MMILPTDNHLLSYAYGLSTSVLKANSDNVFKGVLHLPAGQTILVFIQQKRQYSMFAHFTLFWSFLQCFDYNVYIFYKIWQLNIFCLSHIPVSGSLFGNIRMHHNEYNTAFWNPDMYIKSVTFTFTLGLSSTFFYYVTCSLLIIKLVIFKFPASYAIWQLLSHL